MVACLEPASCVAWHGISNQIKMCTSSHMYCLPHSGLDVAGLFMQPNDVFCFVTHNNGLTTPVYVDSDLPPTTAPLVTALRFACNLQGRSRCR